jgi:hypothetical protein
MLFWIIVGLVLFIGVQILITLEVKQEKRLLEEMKTVSPGLGYKDLKTGLDCEIISTGHLRVDVKMPGVCYKSGDEIWMIPYYTFRNLKIRPQGESSKVFRFQRKE